MFRNSSITRTQTITQNNQNSTTTGSDASSNVGSNPFRGNFQTLQSLNQNQSQRQRQNQTSTSFFGMDFIQADNDQVIFAIVTGNIINLRRLVDSSNVNNIIDKKNKYTALHHAVRIKKNDEIIEYLMSCGANPNIKQDEGKDSIDLAIEANYRFLIDKLLGEKNKDFDDLNCKFKTLEKTNQDLKQTNEFLSKSSNEYVEKIEILKGENLNLKRKLGESEEAFKNLLKKTRKN